MIIHCLTCGKSISSRLLACPYCKAEVTDFTFESNGVQIREKPAEKMKLKFLQVLAKR